MKRWVQGRVGRYLTAVRVGGLLGVVGLGAMSGVAVAQVQGSTVYRCPGHPVLYTDAISAKEAQERGCKTIEGTPITVIPSLRPKSAPAAAAPAASGSGPTTAKVDPGAQRSRDGERRTILDAELSKEEKALVELQKEYNNGEPERRSDERNYQKYLDRVAELKVSIARKEADIAALKREIAKLP